MKVTFIRAENAGNHRDEIVAFHRLRHEIFIDSVGRKDLTSWKKFEYDVWDTSLFSAVHVLLQDDSGDPLGVARMVSSEETTMLEANHPEFLYEPHEKRSDLWEIQRLGIKLNLSSIDTERAILFLLSEITKWCLDNGIRDVMLLTYSGIAKKRLQDMERLGPEAMLVGAPHVALIGRLKKETMLDWMARYRSLTPVAIEESAA